MLLHEGTELQEQQDLFSISHMVLNLNSAAISAKLDSFGN